MREIGFAIVGCGLIADFHARAIEATRGARLHGVFGRSFEKASEFAERHHATAFRSLEELLDSPEIEAVCITTPTGAHGAVVIAALDRGKHVLCEKPLEVTVEKIDAMIQAARRNRRHLAAVFQSRFGTDAKRLKAAVAEGRFGRLSLCSCYIKWWRGQDYYDQGGWRGTKSWDGGGALFNQGIHTIDLLQWICGMPVEVSARLAVLAHERIEVEDTAVALLKYANGALGVIEASTSTWPGVSSRVEIAGSGGSAILENGKIVLWKFSDESFANHGNLPDVDLSGSGAHDPR